MEPGKLKAVFTSSESLLAFQRETIEKAFGAPIRDRYGVSEFGASMTECREGLLHVDMEYCIVEVQSSFVRCRGSVCRESNVHRKYDRSVWTGRATLLAI